MSTTEPNRNGTVETISGLISTFTENNPLYRHLPSAGTQRTGRLKLKLSWKNEGSSYRPSYSHNYNLELQTHISPIKILWHGGQPVHRHGQNHTRPSSKKNTPLMELDQNHPLEAPVPLHREWTQSGCILH